MMRNYKLYGKYKNTYISWIGEIPEHWEVRKLKYLANCFPSNVDKHSREGEQKVRLCNYTDVYKNDFITNQMKLMISTASDEQIVKFTLVKGDIVITKDSETANDIAVPAFVRENLDNVICGYHLSIIRPHVNVIGKYIFWLFKHKKFNSQFEICANGVTRVGLGVYDLQNSFGIYPPPVEQTAIARFLDYKLAKINRFIRKKKQLIKLLNEQKAAIINQAVTKGLDPNAKMKDSGIEWLGDIPEHWEVRKLKYLAEINPSNIDKHTKEGEKIVRLCNYTDVYKNDFITNDMALMIATASDDQIERFTLLPNDVIITKDSETANDIAIPAVVKENLDNVVCGYHLSLMRPNNNIIGEFLFRVLQSKVVNIQFEVNANGVTRVGLGTYSQRNPKIPLPPISEQHKIIDFILSETQAITTTISKIDKEIALVEEYKTALIAEAVTGKIDVRGYEVPEMENEEEGYVELAEELSTASEDAADNETEDTQ